MNKASDTPIQYLKGIGPKRAKVFTGAGINTVEDLLYYFPRRYEDRTNLTPISGLKEGEPATIKAQVLASAERRSWRRRGFSILEAALGDETGKVFCVWFNQPYLKAYFKTGVTLILYGKPERYGNRLQISSPEFEIISEEGDASLDTGRMVPVYRLPQNLTQRSLRRLIKQALDEYLPKINDFISFDIRRRNDLLNLAKSILNIHFPGSPELHRQSLRRISFEEFFLFQLPLALRKLKKKEKPGIPHQVEGRLAQEFIRSLPFKLTRAQEKVLAEISGDMSSPLAMQRLLQGDVGSGKTVVAVIAALFAVQGGYQAAFMAPTEILAKQHFEKVSSWFMVHGPLKNIRVGLLTGSGIKKQKENLLKDIKEGKIDLVIGTHALLEGNVKFKKLGLAVIDEQHKFGVGQRALLPQKGVNPDILIMTATPIPRTLAITLYGDLDISVINELPPGRAEITTMHFKQADKARAYDIVKGHLSRGRQAYIIYPVIEESYALDIAGAKKMYERLKGFEFREFRVGLIHGRLKQEEQDRLMAKFKGAELDMLVSTTVLEVGIDVPAATCMVIEHAERFGLSQLHQLRGRVGRGSDESSCLLISDAQTPEALARIEAMVKYRDGFRIAEEDLKIRGPGEFFGILQHGLAELKVANPLTQMRLLKSAREEAIKLINADPKLDMRQNMPLREKLLQRFPEYEKLVLVG